MALEADLLLDRRRLKRRLILWRVVAVVAVVVAIAATALRGDGVVGGQHVARLSVDGIIREDRRLLESVDRLSTDSSVAAVILSVDSPGGTIAGGESLYRALTRLAAAKPVVTVMRGTAASAAYMIAMPTARVFARDSTLTGSIGVILQTGEASGLLERLGVSAVAITSGPLKDQPSFTRPLTPQGREYLHALVMDMFDQFVAMVAAGRHMDAAKVRELADGRAYTGRQALGLGLIDAIGEERDARAWLADNRHIDTGLPTRDVRPGGWAGRQLTEELLDWVDGWLGHSTVAPGAWAIWQPGETR